MLYITAFFTGLLSSFHCAGMCGPIAMSLPGFGLKHSKFITGRLFYHVGRVITYIFIGLLFGSLGYGLKWVGLQQIFSMAMGFFLIVLFLLRIKIESLFGNMLFKKLGAYLFLKPAHKNGFLSYLLVGIVNGFLPCGFVYLAAIGASVAQDSYQGMLVMALFGLGTFPMMFLISMAGQFIPLSTRNQVIKLAPYLMLLMGLVFILRGLNLGIPYLSPHFETNQLMDPNCK